jgi:hypothetical protein
MRSADWWLRRAGLSGVVASGAERGAGFALVARANARGCETKSRWRGGACSPKVGIVPELLHEGAVAELVSGATDEDLTEGNEGNEEGWDEWDG